MFEVSKPFIIRPNGRPRDNVIPPEHELFNVTIEKRVQFVQGANTFIAMMLVYEIFRYLYYYYHYLGICSDYSYLVAGLIVGDILWIMCSLYGFISIDSRNIKKMHEFNMMLKGVLLSRVIVYIIVAWVMNKYQGVFWDNALEKIEIASDEGQQQTETVVQDLVCNSVYQKGLILMQCIMETIFLFFMIVLSKQIKDYVRAYQHSQVQPIIRN